MSWALALAFLLQAAPDGEGMPAPAGFQVRILRDTTSREERGHLVGGVEFHLSIRAVDADGNLLTGFHGAAAITGTGVTSDSAATFGSSATFGSAATTASASAGRDTGAGPAAGSRSSWPARIRFALPRLLSATSVETRVL